MGSEDLFLGKRCCSGTFRKGEVPMTRGEGRLTAGSETKKGNPDQTAEKGPEEASDRSRQIQEKPEVDPEGGATSGGRSKSFQLPPKGGGPD